MGIRGRSLLTALAASLLALGLPGPAFAATQALPVAVTGSTSWAVASSFGPPPGAPTTFTNFGTKPLVPVIGDWNGDGLRTPGTYEAGHFKLSNTLPPGAPTIDVTFGDPKGFPVVGDFNDDGKDDVAVYRNGLWELRWETPGGIGSGGSVSTPGPFTFGTGSWPTTIPVAGDWDNDGLDGIGHYTHATGLWQLRQTPTGLGLDLASFTYWAGAGTGSYPVVGDWNADGTDSVGVKTATPAGSWQLKNANTAGAIADYTFTFGLANDLPLVGGKASNPPTDIALSPSSVAENQASNTVVGTLTATDPDVGDSHTFALVDNAGFPDNASFNISGSSLRTSAAFNFEAKSSYSIRVRVTDAGGLTYVETLTVTVTNANDAPTDIALSNASVEENKPSEPIGTLTSTDQDAGATHTYTLVSGTGDTHNAQFQIVGNALQTIGGLDFEAGATRSVRIRTTDNGGLTYEESFTITVTDANDAPVADDESFSGVQRAIGNTSYVGNDPSDGAPDPAGPQKTITGDILAGDTDQDPGTSLAVVPGTVTTADGGSVLLEADGDFTFFPKADTSCSDHLDSFNYTLTDQNTTKPPGTAGTDTGTVTIEIQDCVWYVDSSLGAAGNGTSSTPYNSLAPLNVSATDVDAAGDRIFLYDGTYTGGLALESSQPLSGQRHGLTVPDGGAGNVTLEPAGGGNSQINGGLVLASGNTVQGIHLGPAAGFALSGSSVGSATMNTVTSGAINNDASGGGVSINGGTLNMQFTATGGVTSGGGANGIALTNTSGTFNAPSGTLSNASGADVSLNGGTTSFTYGGSISDDVGQLVSISNQTGGTKDFNGNITDLGDGDGSGIALSTNTGATIRFDGGLTLATGANAAFSATAGGTVAVTDPAGANNTIATTTGRALNVANTTIHDDDLTFERISSNGAPNGIVLNSTTNANGVLTVTGGLANACTSVASCTGGAIQNSTGSGVSLTSVPGGVSLTRMAISGSADDGVTGATVGGTGFDLDNAWVNSNGNAPNAGGIHGDHGVDFTGLTGTSTFTNTTVSNSADSNVVVEGASGTMNLNVTGGTYSGAGGGMGDSIYVEANGTGAQNLNVQGPITFANNVGSHVQHNGNPTSTADSDVTVNNAQMSSPVGGGSVLGGGITVVHGGPTAGGGSNTDVTLTNNTIQNSVIGAIVVGTTGSVSNQQIANVDATIANNTIGATGVAGSGSVQGNGIFVDSNGNSNVRTLITNNVIRQWTNRSGIALDVVDGDAGMSATVKGNLLTEPNSAFAGTSTRGMTIQLGTAQVGDAVDVCLDIGDAANAALKNQVAGTGEGAQPDVRYLHEGPGSIVQLVGYAGPAAPALLDIQNWFQPRNNIGGTPTVTGTPTAPGGSTTTNAASCPQPAP